MKTTDNIQRTTEELETKLFERFSLIWRWTAAAILAGCVAAGGMLFESHYKAQQLEAENIQYIEDALDYSMIDNMSIASYLTEAE